MSIIRINSLVKKYQKQTAAVNGVTLDVSEGELLALVGESGSGKTTLLRLIAGLEMPDDGVIEIGDRVVSSPDTFVEAQHRNVAMVFQDYALFPHMNVQDNITFGLHGWPADERKSRVEEVLDLVAMSDMARRYPHQLSGGQQQRVALARALAPRPGIILLDEPFSNLDTVLKDQVREDVRSIIKQSGLTAILVTHDVQDALSTADRIALLKEGSLQQVDTPLNLYNYPQTPYVAAFFGKINLIPAHFKEGQVCTDLMSFPVQSAPRISEGLLCLRPQQVRLTTPSSGFSGKVVAREYQGDLLQFRVKTESQYLWCHTNQEPVNVGQTVYLEFRADHPHFLKTH